MDSVDREPQPSDGPDYHTEHAFWEERARKAEAALGRVSALVDRWDRDSARSLTDWHTPMVVEALREVMNDE